MSPVIALLMLLSVGNGLPLDPAEMVTVHTVDPVVLKPDQTVVVDLVITVTDGVHVQANPAADEFMVPLEFAVDEDPALIVASIAYPEPDLYAYGETEEPSPVVMGRAVLRITLTAPESLVPGAYELTGGLTYQACDATRCWVPQTIAVSIPVTVQARRTGSDDLATTAGSR